MSLKRMMTSGLCLTMLKMAVLTMGVLTTGLLATAQEANPRVLMTTSMGELEIELYVKEAPITTKNFLAYVENGFYEGTIFHRIAVQPSRFVIQGGGFTKDMEKKETLPPIKNESDNGVKNEKYTLSMARTRDPDSATSQFFINLEDNANLDKEYPGSDGYAVFGKVVKGEEVVEKIQAVKTASVRVKGSPKPMQDVPTEAIVIEKVELLDPKSGE